MKDYILKNKKAYNLLAQEFYNKNLIRHSGSKIIADHFSSNLKKRFSNPEVLELGPGTGQVAELLYQNGCNVEAIEFSEEMVKVCKENSPHTNVISGEFLEYDFGDKRYSGVLAVAFVHLFKLNDARLVMKKINDLLIEGGLALISTTIHDKTKEGYLIKENFSGEVKRYRRRYTPKSLEKLIKSVGFNVLEFNRVEDPEIAEKSWMGYLVEKVKL